MLRGNRFVGFAALWTCAASAWGEAEKPSDGLPAAFAFDRGIAVILDRDAGTLALDVARRSGLLVYTRLADPVAVASARAAAAAAGLDPARIQIDQAPADRLWLADNLADGLFAAGGAAVPGDAEILRVLRPGATAVLGGRTLSKPFPDGADDWSHPYHGPDNNPQSRDRLIRAPYMTQFIAEPRYAPAPQVAVAAGGRVFHAFGHVAWHAREEDFLCTLACFNGYNGTLLWRRKLPEGMMVHRNTFVATPETFYYADDRACKALDAATGELRGEIRPPKDAACGTSWKWLGIENGVLHALLGEAEQRDTEVRWKREAHGWPWTQISEGFTRAEHPWGFGQDLIAFDMKSGSVLWRHHENAPADARALCLGDGKLFAFRFGAFLTCLDAKTGAVLWRRTPADDPRLFNALGPPLPRQGWQTNWRTAAYLKCGRGALFFAGPQVGKLLVLSADDGRILWEDAYDNFQLVLRDDGLYAVGGGKWGENISRKFEPLTGKVLAELPIGRRACTRPTGTADSVLFRAMGGSVRFDTTALQPRWISPMRPECHNGVIVANGHLYWSPYACDCQLTLNGFVSVGPAGNFDPGAQGAGPSRLERAAEPAPASPMENPDDWLVFRGNNRATCASRAMVPGQPAQRWQVRLPVAADVRVSAPTIAGGLVFVGDSAGCVRGLELANGRERWRYHTGGEVRLPPTVWGGRALFGSGDGWVYACDAATGRLLWRFRAAPVERKIPVFGRLLSTWPASSGILVESGTAYVAAGIVNYDGTFVYALDAATGAVKWCNTTSGHLDAAARTGVSAQGHMLLDQGRLYLAGGNAVSPGIYDIADGRCLNDPAPLARCESTSPRGWELFLVGDRVIAAGKPYYAHPDIPVYDHTVTRKLLHASNGESDIVWLDGEKLLGFAPLAREELNRCVSSDKIPQHITQGWGAFKTATPPLWSRACPQSATAALARNAALVASPAQVAAVRLDDGADLWTRPLPAPPVPWGLAVGARGDVVLVLADARLVCFGAAKP